ncbi:hypothetical protein C8R44DRAFT_846935 [Mycena epipterygia]|nr:hypothetical protein C8R44DRAFT_846935 [Mycena epipterygia]
MRTRLSMFAARRTHDERGIENGWGHPVTTQALEGDIARSRSIDYLRVDEPIVYHDDDWKGAVKHNGNKIRVEMRPERERREGGSISTVRDARKSGENLAHPRRRSQTRGSSAISNPLSSGAAPKSSSSAYFDRHPLSTSEEVVLSTDSASLPLGPCSRGKTRATADHRLQLHAPSMRAMQLGSRRKPARRIGRRIGGRYRAGGGCTIQRDAHHTEQQRGLAATFFACIVILRRTIEVFSGNGAMVITMQVGMLGGVETIGEETVGGGPRRLRRWRARVGGGSRAARVECRAPRPTSNTSPGRGDAARTGLGAELAARAEVGSSDRDTSGRRLVPVSQHHITHSEGPHPGPPSALHDARGRLTLAASAGSNLNPASPGGSGTTWWTAMCCRDSKRHYDRTEISGGVGWVSPVTPRPGGVELERPGDVCSHILSTWWMVAKRRRENQNVNVKTTFERGTQAELSLLLLHVWTTAYLGIPCVSVKREREARCSKNASKAHSKTMGSPPSFRTLLFCIFLSSQTRTLDLDSTAASSRRYSFRVEVSKDDDRLHKDTRRGHRPLCEPIGREEVRSRSRYRLDADSPDTLETRGLPPPSTGTRPHAKVSSEDAKMQEGGADIGKNGARCISSSDTMIPLAREGLVAVDGSVVDAADAGHSDRTFIHRPLNAGRARLPNAGKSVVGTAGCFFIDSVLRVYMRAAENILVQESVLRVVIEGNGDGKRAPVDGE